MNKTSLKKSVVALTLLVAIGSVGFDSAYGYGGGGGTRAQKVQVCHDGNTISVSKSALSAHLKHGDTEGACTASPLVLGASSTNQNNAQQFSPILSSISNLLKSIQTGNQAGDISDEDTSKLTGQLASVISALMAMFR